MKIVRATPSHAYHVFKLLRDYAEDAGLTRPSLEDYPTLLTDLLDESKYYSILMHGKNAAGLFWGQRSFSENSFTIHGRFLRRRFRNFKFKRALVQETLEARKSFDKLKLILPPKSKISPRLKPVGLIVEEVR